MTKNITSLSPRLSKIYSLVPNNRCTADIGTDHAYIPIALIENGKAETAIASDIKAGPIKRADSNIKSHRLSGKIETRLGPGLETLSINEAEVIIIAGMGGILISNILEASRDVVNSAKFLILQPMTAVKELREYLSEKNFTVCGEYLVAEENKLYNIITAQPTGKTDYSLKELYFGKDIEKTSPELYSQYKNSVLKKLEKRISGLEKSQNDENKKVLNELSELLNVIKEDNK